MGNNGGVVAPPNGELVPTYGVYIVPWAPTMRIDTSTASSTLLIVEIWGGVQTHYTTIPYDSLTVLLSPLGCLTNSDKRLYTKTSLDS